MGLFLVFALKHIEHQPIRPNGSLSAIAVRIEFGMTTDSLGHADAVGRHGRRVGDSCLLAGLHERRPGFSRFFACLSLFTFSMLGIVLSNNFIQMFIFWELVGVSSYLLIGFWFEKPSAAEAGKKAFLVNRIGDFGMMLGILLLWSYAGTFNFADLQDKLPIARIVDWHPGADRRADFLWRGRQERAVPAARLVARRDGRPDAGFGIDPCGDDGGGGRLHALPRVVADFAERDGAALIAWIGGITALMAATIAIAQNDIKRILAYSTLSQLGYMVMAVGLGGPTQAMFHLTTHAFFKALLFLGAGSVILALHHEQDIWKMGGFGRRCRSRSGHF